MIPDAILKMYQNEELGKNIICQKCISNATKQCGWISRPLSIWHVGKDYSKDEYKIMFVGKPHRGEPYFADLDPQSAVYGRKMDSFKLK